jgi:type I restriction enzyme S subunit
VKNQKANWTRVGFSEVVERVIETAVPSHDESKSYIGLEHLDSDSLSVRRWGSEVKLVVPKTRIKKGDVLFARRNTHLRRCAVAPFDTCFSPDGYAFRSKSSSLLQSFLLYVVASDAFMEFAIERSAGTHSKRVKWSDLLDYQFGLPPIEDQRRIVGVLLAIHLLESHLEHLRLALDVTETAMLNSAFGPTYDHPTLGAPLVVLGDLADVRTGLAKGRRADTTTTTRPYLRVANVKDGALDLSEMKEIVVEPDKVERFSLRHADVLMTEGGDLDKLGRGTVWQNEIEGCLHQNHVFAVRADDTRLDPWYLAALARSPYGRSYFLRCAKRSSNLASVNKAQVASFLVPLRPLQQQKLWLQQYLALRELQTSAARRVVASHYLMKKILELNGI